MSQEKTFEENREVPLEPEFKDSITIGDKVINRLDEVKVLRSSGEIESDWFFMSLDARENLVLVRNHDGKLQKRVPLDEFIEWQSK